MKQTVEIMDISFINATMEEMVSIVTERVEKEEKTFIVTANPEIVMHTKQDPDYKKIVQSADYVVADGVGILLAGKWLNKPIVERVAGFDLMMELLTFANSTGKKVYLLGGREETNEKAASAIKRDFPHLHLVGNHHGYFDWADHTIRKEIQALEPDFVFVALGYPKQEQWIEENLPSFSKGVFMGVGGSVDVLAGEVKRAPEVWRNLKLEWLYRLLKQPSRWRRMLAIPKFVFEILKIKLIKR